MSSNTFRDRQILAAAQEKGLFSTFLAFLRLSGPGWLQAAVTLGGGSLSAALFLGMVGGYSLLWVQVIAMLCGVVMLAAISHVTLSTGLRPYAAMSQYINPVLAAAWITATIIANMIYIMPQFGLAYDALQANLLPQALDDETNTKYIASSVIAAIAFVSILLSLKPGWMSKAFDWLLKLIVGAIVVCFVGAVIQLFRNGSIDTDVFHGLLPKLNELLLPAPEIEKLIQSETIDDVSRSFWDGELAAHKKERMIASAAAAVGINMTFLLPYSMLARGWDKTFRGLSLWDLITGMAIPFIVVTACIVITTGYAFHAQADQDLLSGDPAVVVKSEFYKSVAEQVNKKLKGSAELQAVQSNDEAKAEFLAKTVAEMPPEEVKLAVTLSKPSSDRLAVALEPLLGKERAQLMFGIGVLGMAFSTIIILAVINGFAFGELFGNYENVPLRIIGIVAALVVGVFWVEFWEGEAKPYLSIIAGTFAILLLPIAYFLFLLMMNSRTLMRSEKPVGIKMIVWNVLMFASLAVACFAAYTSLQDKLADQETGPIVKGGLIVFAILALIGFSARGGLHAEEISDRTPEP